MAGCMRELMVEAQPTQSVSPSIHPSHSVMAITSETQSAQMS